MGPVIAVFCAVMRKSGGTAIFDVASYQPTKNKRDMALPVLFALVALSCQYTNALTENFTRSIVQERRELPIWEIGNYARKKPAVDSPPSSRCKIHVYLYGSHTTLPLGARNKPSQ